MREYEIRVLKSARLPGIITTEIHLSDQAAIRSARKIAIGRQFEVWCGLECITGLARTPQSPGGSPVETGAASV